MAQATKSTGAETIRWNLSDLFASPDDPRIEQTLAREMERAKAFEVSYKGKVATLEPKAFAAMMRELEEYEKSAAKPEIYAFMLHSENTQDHAAGRLLARVREASAERSSHMVFFFLELAQIADEHAAKLFADPEAAAYRHTVEEARKYRPHQLSEPEERVLTDFSPVGNGSWVRLFEELCARIRVDVEGRDLALDEALTLLRESDREVRRKASGAVTEALRGDARTRGYIFNVILQEKAIDDRLRHFPTWISSRNLANETSDQAVQALVDAGSPSIGDAELPGQAARRACPGARARARPPRSARCEAKRVRLPPAAHPRRDSLGVRGGFDLRPDHGRGKRPEGEAGAAVRPGRGRVRHRVPAGRLQPLRGRNAQRAPDGGGAVRRPAGRHLPGEAPGDVRRRPDPHRRAQGVVELRRALPPHAGLRLRLRLRKPAGAVGVSPVPGARTGLCRRLPELPGGRRVDET